MASPECAWGLPKPSKTSFKAAETSSSRPASRTIFLNRLDSSTEIIFAPGELGDFAALARRFDFRADAFFRHGHFAGRQTVFLQRVVGGDDFHRAQRHDLAFKHKTDILPDRKSTRLNSSHLGISYAVFCL